MNRGNQGNCKERGCFNQNQNNKGCNKGNSNSNVNGYNQSNGNKKGGNRYNNGNKQGFKPKEYCSLCGFKNHFATDGCPNIQDDMGKDHSCHSPVKTPALTVLVLSTPV